MTAEDIKSMIRKIEEVQPFVGEINKRLQQMISGTFDYDCDGIDGFWLDNDIVSCRYQYSWCNETNWDHVAIPVQWLEDGFDYAAAYAEMKRIKEEERLAAEAEEKKRKEAAEKAAEASRASEEYETYLKLKEKYEGSSKI